MQLTKILGSLADVYGRIFLTPYGEIDMSDVVLNPSNSYRHASRPGEVRGRNRHLGKIIVVTLKGMMGSTLGSEIENT